MHEVALVEDALQLAIGTARAAGARRIDRLTLAVVVGGHVTEDAVSLLFAGLSRGTLAEGAELSFERRLARWSCWSCGHSFTSVDGPTCSRCAEAALLADNAPELILRSIDVATNDPPDPESRRDPGGQAAMGGTAHVSGNARPD